PRRVRAHTPEAIRVDVDCSGKHGANRSRVERFDVVIVEIEFQKLLTLPLGNLCSNNPEIRLPNDVCDADASDGQETWSVVVRVFGRHFCRPFHEVDDGKAVRRVLARELESINGIPALYVLDPATTCSILLDVILAEKQTTGGVPYLTSFIVA